jgi:hypothetical protein
MELGDWPGYESEPKNEDKLLVLEGQCQRDELGNAAISRDGTPCAEKRVGQKRLPTPLFDPLTYEVDRRAPRNGVEPGLIIID